MKSFNTYEQNKRNAEVCDKEATRVTNMLLFEEPIISSEKLTDIEIYDKQKIWMHRYMLEYVKAMNALINVEVVKLLDQSPKNYQQSSFYN